MICYNVGLYTRFQEIAQYFQRNVRDYCEVNGAVIRKPQPSDSVNIDTIPEALEEFIFVDSTKDSLEFEIRVEREIDQKIRTMRERWELLRFKNVLEPEKIRKHMHSER